MPSYDPVVLRGGAGAAQRRDALARLRSDDGPLLVVATGPYIGEGFDCPALDTLFLAAPIAFKGRLVQYAGRVLRPAPGKHLVEVHDYHAFKTAVLASSLRKRAPGYTRLGFPDPRRRTSRRGSPLKLPHSLVLTNDVGVICARVDSPRNASSSRAPNGLSTAANSWYWYSAETSAGG